LQYFGIYVDRVDCNILIVAYRGYSDSEGTPDEEGLKLDGEAMLQLAFASNLEIDST
jgi:hypothetical protein